VQIFSQAISRFLASLAIWTIDFLMSVLSERFYA
jgi:hypothetical protein